MSQPDSAADNDYIGFRSLAELRMAHARLVREQGAESLPPDFAMDVRIFIERAVPTGELLNEDADRSSAQSLIDYWATVLYREGEQPPETSLARFSATAPTRELKDEDCPYLGLEVFTEERTGIFFGREKLIRAWLDRLREGKFLAITGPSGSGKSSLVRAGLLVQLKSGALPGSDAWRYLGPTAPRSEPLVQLARLFDPPPGEELESALRNESQRFLKDRAHLAKSLGTEPITLLAIDRFEELFTRCKPAERDAFLANLATVIEAPGSAHRVIVTMRRDVLSPEDLALQLGPLQKHFAAAEAPVPPLDTRELREAIEKPANIIGLEFEPGLVNALLDDVAGDPAALPLLQLTLRKLWEHREGNWITWKAYRAVGAGRGILERTAEGLYTGFATDQEREITRELLLRMVRPGPELDLIFSSIRQDAVLEGHPPAKVLGVLDQFVSAGLLRRRGAGSGEAYVEVAHEALVFQWPRLMDWLGSERSRDQGRRRLTSAAAQWQESGRPPEALWGGAMLDEARLSKDLTDLERVFIDASIGEEVRRARSRSRKLVWVLCVMAALSATALYHAHLARRQEKEAHRQKEQADVQRNQARENLVKMYMARSLAAVAEHDAPGAALWCAETLEQQPEGEAAETHRQQLSIAYRQMPLLVQILPADEMRLIQAVISPSGDLAVTASEQHGAKIWNVLTGAAHALTRPDWVNRVAFSPDGTRVLSAHGRPGLGGGEAYVWDVARFMETGEAKCIATLPFGGAVLDVAFNPANPNLIATVGEDGTGKGGLVSVWNLASPHPELPVSAQHFPVPVKRAIFTTDGARLVQAFGAGATADVNRTVDLSGDPRLVMVRDWTDKKPPVLIHEERAAVTQVAISADGLHVATAADRHARIWNAATGEATTLPLLHAAGIRDVAFSPDNTRLLTVSDDCTGRIWDVVSGRNVATLRHDGQLYHGRFSNDGRYVITSGRDRQARVWSVDTGELALPPLHHGGTVTYPAFDGHDRRIITTTPEGARVWEASTLLPPAPVFDPDDSVSRAAFNRDATRMVTVSNGFARVWDPRKAEKIGPRLRLPKADRAALSPDGKYVAVAASDGGTRVWEVGKGEEPLPAPLPHEGRRVSFVGFNPRGDRLLTVAADEEGRATVVRVWDFMTGGTPQLTLRGGEPVVFAGWSPDENLLVTAGGLSSVKRGLAEVWNAKTGARIGAIEEHTELVKCAAFSPDSRQLVTGSVDDSVRVWSVENGRVARTSVFLHTADLNSVAFGPDGRSVISASADTTAIVWSLGQTDPLAVFNHDSAVMDAAFNGDGSRVATGSADKTVRVWDVRRGELVGVFTHENGVERVAFTADGKGVAALNYNYVHVRLNIPTASGPAAPQTANLAAGVALLYNPEKGREEAQQIVQPRVWDVSVDAHPAETLRALAQVVGAREVRDARLARSKAPEVLKRWQAIREKFPQSMRSAKPAVFHLREADRCEFLKQWFAASWHLTKALDEVKRPLSRPLVLYRRSNAAFALRMWDQVIADCTEALVLLPDDHRLRPHAHSLRGEAWFEKFEAPKAADDFQAAIDAGGNQKSLLSKLARVFAQQERWPEAADRLRQATQIEPLDDPSYWEKLATVYLASGQQAEYRAVCAELIEKFGANREQGSAVAWPCVLSADSGVDVAKVVELAKAGVDLKPDSYYRLNTLGAAYLRAGRLNEAIETLRRSMDAFRETQAEQLAQVQNELSQATLESLPHGRPVDWVLLAMAYWGKGDKGRVGEMLDKARDALAFQARAQKLRPGPGENVGASNWRYTWNVIELQLLVKEAARMISGQPPAAP